MFSHHGDAFARLAGRSIPPPSANQPTTHHGAFMPHDDQTGDSGGATRREFLKDIALLGAGSWVFAACASSTASTTTTSASSARVFSAIRPTADRVGIQLFTVRDQ